MTTVPPNRENAPYAIPVSAALQRQLGVNDGKPSWILANHINLVEPPNPAIHMARENSWTHGQIPPGLLSVMRDKRELALGAKATELASIRKDTSLDRYRSATQVTRLTPGQSGNNEARAADIRAKAIERRSTLSVNRPVNRIKDVSR